MYFLNHSAVLLLCSLQIAFAILSFASKLRMWRVPFPSFIFLPALMRRASFTLFVFLPTCRKSFCDYSAVLLLCLLQIAFAILSFASKLRMWRVPFTSFVFLPTCRKSFRIFQTLQPRRIFKSLNKAKRNCLFQNNYNQKVFDNQGFG